MREPRRRSPRNSAGARARSPKLDTQGLAALRTRKEDGMDAAVKSVRYVTDYAAVTSDFSFAISRAKAYIIPRLGYAMEARKRDPVARWLRGDSSNCPLP